MGWVSSSVSRAKSLSLPDKSKGSVPELTDRDELTKNKTITASTPSLTRKPFSETPQSADHTGHKHPTPKLTRPLLNTVGRPAAKAKHPGKAGSNSKQRAQYDTYFLYGEREDGLFMRKQPQVF